MAFGLSGQATSALGQWLLDRPDAPPVEGPYQPPRVEHTQPWWRVMCLTGVDYFSTLGYQPGIAALAAGALAPLATLILVALTLVGALPMYARVAEESPHGEGSIAILERLFSWWTGKLFVLVLLGFAATDFVITITLSAADAAAHAVQNPYAPAALSSQPVATTLALVAVLGAIFLKGFREAISLAVVLVLIYLALNVVVVGVALAHVLQHPAVIGDWQRALVTQHGSPLAMLGVSLLLFPKLALGLSGFETGVAVMPLVRGDPSDTEAHPAGRIRDTRRLLVTAALLMSGFLLASSIATITLIPAAEFEEGGRANGRALAYLAHSFLGDAFGTVYDVSTILILWFAGASAMAGLLNLVPRYLPRYGMAPEWASANRPLVLVFTAIAFAVTLIFRASVDAQGGAYATGVLVLMSSAAAAVAITAWRRRHRRASLIFGAIVAVFAYTTVANVLERPDGVKIAAFFIAAIVLTSVLSRLWRVTELRVSGVDLDPTARQFLFEATRGTPLRLIAHSPATGAVEEYAAKDQQHRDCSAIPAGEPVVFLEVGVRDPSEFQARLAVRGQTVGPYRVLRAESTAVPNAIAAFLLHARELTGALPHAYFSWSEGPPLSHVLSYLLFGEGDIAPVTHEVLRAAEPDLERRPVVHVS